MRPDDLEAPPRDPDAAGVTSEAVGRVVNPRESPFGMGDGRRKLGPSIRGLQVFPHTLFQPGEHSRVQSDVVGEDLGQRLVGRTGPLPDDRDELLPVHRPGLKGVQTEEQVAWCSNSAGQRGPPRRDEENTFGAVPIAQPDREGTPPGFPADDKKFTSGPEGRYGPPPDDCHSGPNAVIGPENTWFHRGAIAQGPGADHALVRDTKPPPGRVSSCGEGGEVRGSHIGDLGPAWFHSLADSCFFC